MVMVNLIIKSLQLYFVEDKELDHKLLNHREATRLHLNQAKIKECQEEMNQIQLLLLSSSETKSRQEVPEVLLVFKNSSLLWMTMEAKVFHCMNSQRLAEISKSESVMIMCLFCLNNLTPTEMVLLTLTNFSMPSEEN